MSAWSTTSTTGLMVADWNGDGILDVGMTGTDWPNGRIASELKIWLGQAGGGYVASNTVLAAPLSTYFVRTMKAADFNGDHRDDIYLGTVGDEIAATGEPDVVLLSSANGGLLRAAGPAIDRASYSHGPSVGDVDRDGDIDIFQSGGYPVGGRTEGPTVGSRLLLNDGAGNFTDASTRLPADLQAAALRPVFASAIADLNGDGWADLIVGHKGGAKPVLRTDGANSWYDYQPTGFEGGYYLGDGHGGFGAFTALPAGVLPVWNSDTIDIQVFDANGDGRPDIVFSNYNSGYVKTATGALQYDGQETAGNPNAQGTVRDLQLFLNTGNGAFSDASAQISGAGNGVGGGAPIFQMFPVDLDGDGRLDLVGAVTRDMVQDSSAGPLAWLNSGDGRFTPFDLQAVLRQSGAPSIWNIAVFDANGDGRPDIGYQTYNPIPGGTTAGPAFGVLINAGAAPRALSGSPSGNDTLSGASGPDTLQATSGSNYLRGNAGADSIVGGAGFDDINGNMGDDTASGGAGDDWVVGGKDNDVLRGDAGADIVYGNLGNDTCEGGEGDDLVRGGQQNDLILGGAGNDWLSGDKGDDTITGGDGADIFHTFGDAGLDRVTDFSVAAGDRVQLDPGTTWNAAQVGSDTVISMGGGGQMILIGVQMSTLPGGWIFGA